MLPVCFFDMLKFVCLWNVLVRLRCFVFGCLFKHVFVVIILGGGGGVGVLFIS